MRAAEMTAEPARLAAGLVAAGLAAAGLAAEVMVVGLKETVTRRRWGGD
jgi:hypothetical protein